MFSKRVGLAMSDMVKESWIYRKLRSFRAGIEGVIFFRGRAFGRCTRSESYAFAKKTPNHDPILRFR